MNSSTIDLASSSASEVLAKSDMDPRLQYLLVKQRSGMTKEASSSTDVDEVAIIARVTSFTDWQSKSEIRNPTLIGSTDDREYIVTGRVPLHRVERLRSQPFVKSMKAATPVRPMLSETLTEIEAKPTALPTASQANGGAGTVVGIVDYGGDFGHQNFRKVDGSTRLLSLWDQNGGNMPSSPNGYGKEFTTQEINLALRQADPYGALGYNPKNFDTGTGTHGTHVMDIAAGNGRGTTFPGVAPEADLMFVNITHEKDPTSPDDLTKSSFGNSVALLEAIRYIFDKAGEKPCVVNVSLGTNGGPHDGTTLVEQAIDSMLKQKPNRAVVLAASNSFDDGIHERGKVTQGGTATLTWQVAARLSTEIEMDIWYKSSDRLTVELLGPDGVTLLKVTPGSSDQLLAPNGSVAIFVANRLDDPNNHDNMVGIYFGRGMPAGKYTVKVHGDTVSDGTFHAWIERDNRFQSQFIPASGQPDNSYTIGSVSCGQKLIAVGSYDARASGKPLSFFSSAGPTRDGRQKPEVSAPGHGVWAAKSNTGTGITSKSGTSMAAPAVAGLISLVFAEAKSRNIKLSIDETRQIVIDSVRRIPPAGTAWHDRYGFGRVSAAKAVQAVISKATTGAVSTTAAAKKKKRNKKN